MGRRSLAVLVLAGLTGFSQAAAPPRPELPEGLRMFLTIAAGHEPGPGKGWFTPSKSEYGWAWFAERFDANGDGAVSADEFRGPRGMFARLDRDGDGRLTAADFDWSPRSPVVQRDALAYQLFRRGDRNVNGRISAEEWQEMFKMASGGKASLTPEDVRRMLFPPPRPDKDKTQAAANDGPSRWTLLHGLFMGEIGSIYEGPALGAKGPDFTLKTQDGKRTVTLSNYRDKRPVVLIFGSFT